MEGFHTVYGKPLLDYTIRSLRKVGVKNICFVIGPEHVEMRRYYEELDKGLADISIHFAIQQKPLGTADAVYSAREFVEDDSFITMKGDNLYRIDAVKILREQVKEIC